MPDKQIHPIGDEAAPADYVIPPSAELLLKSVHAKYDGSGAASSFVPLVRIISDAGSTTDEVPQDVTVAAGGSADATWFPHVGAAATAAAGSSLPACFVDGPDLTLGTWTPSNYTAVTWDLFDTNDSSTFAWPGSGGNTTVARLTKGLYRAVFIPQFSGFAFPSGPGLFIYTIVGFSGNRDPTELSINATNSAWAVGNQNAAGRDAPHVDEIFNLPGAGDFKVDTAWTGAGSITFTPRMYVYRIGDQLV